MMTTKHWLGTAALVLAIGTGSGVAFAQNQPETKHEEGRPAASQHEMNRGETRGGAAAEHGASEAKQGAREGQGAAGAAHEQAQSHEAKPAAGQSAQQSGRGEHDQSAQRDREQGREAKESSKEPSKDAAESKQKQGAADERKNENKSAAETNKTESNKAAQSGQQKQEQQADHHDRNPANATQQSQEERKGPASEQTAGKQQGTDRNGTNQAQSRPNNTTTQQNSQTDPNQRNAAGQPQNNAGQAQNNQAGRGSSRTSVSVNDQQRTRVFDQLRHDREFDQARSDVDIRVNVGERVPERVRPRPLPSDIVTIVPEYRGYDYTVVHDEIAIIDPRSREIVDVIPQGGGSADRYAGGYGGTRVTLTDDQRQILFRSATVTSTVGSTSPSSGSSSSGPTCLSLRQVPEELAKSNPELASYQYLTIGDQVVLVDPQNQKVVQVIDQQQQQQQSQQ